MKKSYLMIAAAATLFAACAGNDTFKESVKDNNSQPFTFSAYADKATKAPNTNSTELQDFYKVFGVYGYKNVKRGGTATVETVFNNVPNEYFASDVKGTVVFNGDGEKPSDQWKTKFTAGEWYYEDIRYWDKLASSYAFFAIAPYESDPDPELSVSSTSANISIGSSSDKYDIQTEKNLAIKGEPAVPQAALSYSGFNKDYMLAEKSNSTQSDVMMIFHHILSKLNVKIVKSANYIWNNSITINELMISGFDKEGYYAYNSNFTTNGWTTSEKFDQTITANYLITGDANYSGCYWLETLMFPQTTICKAIGAKDSNDGMSDMYLYIQYHIGNEKYEAYYDFANIWGATTTNNGVNDATNSFEFKPGNEYTLTLTVGPEPIHFDTEVTQWANITTPNEENIDL